jgi:amino-acid N-acetyltransferase
MLEVSKLKKEEIDRLGSLLKSDQLCFNDINNNGVHLYSVSYKDEAVGYFGYELFDNLALFRSMVVVPKVRNQGYGKLIWQQAKTRLEEAGVKEVFLLTNTASPFFAKQNFVIIERGSVPSSIADTTEFKDFCPADSICMKIDLG